MADYDVSNLSTYLEQQKGMLIRASLLEGKTASKITIQPGIKFQEAINILDVNPSIILGGNDCSDFTASGTTIYKQRTIEVCDLLAEDNLCAAKLNKYFLQNQIAPGKAGLLHISKIPRERQQQLDQFYKIGEIVDVRVMEVDQESGKIRLDFVTKK